MLRYWGSATPFCRTLKQRLALEDWRKTSQEDARIVFADSDVGAVYVYDMPVRILLPSGNPSEMRLPSLLGRDIINRWRVVYDHPAPELSAEVLASDFKHSL